MKLINVEAPIYPGKSIANITLGMKFYELQKYVDVNSEDKAFIGSTCYTLFDGAVSIGVHDRSKKVFRVSANSGYKGLLLEEFGVGMSIELLLLKSDWQFDESQGGMKSSLYPGVIVCIELEDPEFEELAGQNIFEISVFVDNIDNLDDTWK